MPPTLAALLPDAITAAATAALWIGYHRWLRWKLTRDPLYTTQAVNARARAQWVAWAMAAPGREIMAAQILRNSMMASAFIGTTSSLLILGILTLSSQPHDHSAAWNVLNAFGESVPGLWLAKLLALLVDLLVAFFCALQSIRLLNHAGYLAALPPEARDSALHPARAAGVVNRAADYSGRAIRAFFLAVPLTFWLFGPWFMLGAAAVVVWLLYRFDRAGD